MKKLFTIVFVIFSLTAFSQAPDTVAWMSKRQILKLGLRGGTADTFMLKFHGTSGLGTPVGTTAQRPFVPTGWIVFRYNTDSLAMEFGTDAQAWFKMAGGGAAGITTLAGLTDVNISSPANGHMLVYRTSDNKWHNESVSLSSAFVNGGNAFGAGSTFGNTDNFGLSAITNNIARLVITNGGAVSIPTGSLTLGSTGTNGAFNMARSSDGVTIFAASISGSNVILNGVGGTIDIQSGGTTRFRVAANGLYVGGGSSSSARLQITASNGTANTQPLLFESGTLLSVPVARSLEIDNADKIYYTIPTGTARKEFTLNDAALTSGRIPFTTTNGRILDDAGLLWDNTSKFASVQTGTTSTTARVGGTTWKSSTTTGTSGTGETDLSTRTTAASELAADLQHLEYYVSGIVNPTSTNDGGTNTIKVYWAGTQVATGVALAGTAAPYVVKVTVLRTSSSNARVTVEIEGGTFPTGTSPTVTDVTTTFTNTNIIKVTGQSSDTDQTMNASTHILKWWPQN